MPLEFPSLGLVGFGPFPNTFNRSAPFASRWVSAVNYFAVKLEMSIPLGVKRE